VLYWYGVGVQVLVNDTPRPLYTPVGTAVSIVHEAAWASVPV